MRRQTEYLTQQTNKGEKKRQKEKLFSTVMTSTLLVLKKGE